jgi:8-oxo-dGTP pyrophosphatase MutT (NUDIX family)
MSAQSLAKCVKGCCFIATKPYYGTHSFYDKYRKLKAGVFFYDPSMEKVLLVQSRGMKWGPPKGTMEYTDNSIEDCAIREVKEETGIDVDLQTSTDKFRIDRATYFYIETSSSPDIMPIPNGINNDASGITWIGVDCLDNMNLNSHCKKLIQRYCKK